MLRWMQPYHQCISEGDAAGLFIIAHSAGPGPPRSGFTAVESEVAIVCLSDRKAGDNEPL